MDSAKAKSVPRRLDRPAAWLCFLANVLVLPGVGNAIAGKRSGFVQAGMALAGFALTLLWGMWFVAEWARRQELPIELNWQLGVGLLGVALFGGAWVWAFVGGARVVKDSKSPQAPGRAD